MKLGPKIVCLILLAYVGYLTASHLIQELVIQPSFVSLEREKAVENVERCRDALSREIDHLSVQCQDWASWDDTYQFMVDHNEDYLAASLTSGSFLTIQMNLIYYYSPDGEFVWGRAYDLSDEEPVEIASALEDLAKYPGLNTRDEQIGSMSGIVATRHGPMLIAAQPILTSERTGPAHGTLVMGRLVTDDKINLIAEQTKVDLAVWPVEDPKLPAEDRQVLEGISSEDSVKLVEYADNIDGYTVYYDVKGDPILLLHAYLPSQIIASGAEAMYFAMLSICVAGFITMLLLFFAMQRIVVNPLGRLISHTSKVGETGNLSSRISMKRDDEIGRLADTLDDMMGHLAQSRTALAEASRAAGKSDVASRVLHNVGNVLNSVNQSAQTTTDRLARLPINDLSKIVGLLKAHTGDLGRYLSEDPKGSLIPDYLGELSLQLTRDREDLSREMLALREHISHIKRVVAMQQDVGKVTKVEEIGSIEAAVEDAITINRPLMEEHNVQISRSIEPLPAILFDRHMLMDIVINLVSNAVHAVEGNPEDSRELRVTIQRDNAGGEALIVVADNGIGIKPENQTQVFNHGFTTRAKGHGFGLHSAALAAKSMGGSLTVHSDGPGKGTTFTLAVPMKTAEERAA